MFDDVARGGLRLRTVRAWQSLPVRHAFTDRHGGVSGAPYDTLNVGLHVGDDAANVRANRARVCSALDCDPRRLVAGEQVHGNRVAVVTAADAGRGALRSEDSMQAVDALVTATPEITLISFFADCVPILLFDMETPAVGIVHAGWRGTALAAVTAAVQAMTAAFGTKAERLLAAIGPSIGPCCYAVGDDVATQLRAAVQRSPGDGAAATVAASRTDDSDDSTTRSGPVFGRRGEDLVVVRRDASIYADLQRANKLLLTGSGVPGENIHIDRMCTRCQSDRFFSYRAARGVTGRTAALIGLGSATA